MLLPDLIWTSYLWLCLLRKLELQLSPAFERQHVAFRSLVGKSKCRLLNNPFEGPVTIFMPGYASSVGIFSGDCLHQVSYHTFYQWVTYDWWEPRLLFSFICDPSGWTTGITRLLNSLNAWRQGLPVLIQAGSEWYYSPADDGRRDQRRKGREKEGKGGIPFVNSGNSGSAGSLALGGSVWGAVRFLHLRKLTVRTWPWRHPLILWGRRGRRWVLCN